MILTSSVDFILMDEEFEIKLRLDDMFVSDMVVHLQKQPSRGVLSKRCSENMQQIYRRTPMPKCDFNKVGLQLY